VGRTAKAQKEVLELIRLQAQGKHLAHPIAAVYAGLGIMIKHFAGSTWLTKRAMDLLSC
jgi:hypothetical protein